MRLEAALVEGIDVYPVETFSALVSHLAGDQPIAPFVRGAQPFGEAFHYTGTDFSEVRGQEHVKRALEVAAAGGHNLLMVGPAGAGKTLLARAIPSVLPSMVPDEALMVTRIYSVAGLLARDVPLITQRPFRAPAPHRVPGRPRRGRPSATARRNQLVASWCALSGRATRVRTADIGSPPPTAGGPRGHDQPSPGVRDLSRQLYAHCRHEPVPLRQLWRSDQSLCLF